MSLSSTPQERGELVVIVMFAPTEAGRGLYESEGFAEGGPFAHMTRWRR